MNARESTPTPAEPGADPVLVRRAQMARLARAGNRIGYGCLAVAVVAFFAGFAVGYGVCGPVVVAALAASAVTLAPAIVIGYAVKAADREDRQAGRLP